MSSGLLLVFMPLLFSMALGQGNQKGIIMVPDVRALLVSEGSDQVLNCSVVVDKDPTVQTVSLTWSGRSGTQTEEYNPNPQDGTFTVTRLLTFQSVAPGDYGQYTCIYQGVANEERKIKLIKMTVNKEEGEFFFGNKTQSLYCSVGLSLSTGTATFSKWMKGDVELKDLKNPDRFTSAPNGTLTIDKPTREDTGIYHAVYNLSGTDVTTYKCPVMYKGAPLVLDFKKSKNVWEEDDLELTCKVIGYPPATVTWRLDGKELLADGDHVVMTNKDGHVNAHLLVKSLSASDEGDYKCIATNEYNETSEKHILVRVKDPLNWLWPLIGILCEVVVLVIIIFACEKLRKKEEKAADHTD